MVGLPHTVVSTDYSHCAFTGKVLRFSTMMNPHGWHVVEYSNGVSESAAAEKVQILTEGELRAMSKRRSDTEDYGADVNNRPLVDEFSRRVVAELRARTAPGDIVCHVFGPYPDYIGAAPACFHLESGIGYTATTGACPYRVYESAGWMHWHLGRRHLEHGKNYEFVAPNYYESADWPAVTNPLADPYILYFGRITETKGMAIILEIALKMPEVRFVLCGQGDPSPWLKAPNIIAIPPVNGRARAAVLGGASVLLAPTMFIEPFCGAAVEAQFCGTPVVTSAYGAFWETVLDGVTGFRCNSLADYVGALRRAPALDRGFVALRARSLYSLEVVGKTYNMIFNNIADQRNAGWYSPRSHKFGSVEFAESAPAPAAAAPAPERVVDGDVVWHITRAAPAVASPALAYDYDWVEIGTGDFETKGLVPFTIERGALVEPLAGYLNRLPNGKNVMKVNAAICAEDGNALVYHLDPDVILAHGMPDWLRGCNRMYEPHPLALQELDARGLPRTLVREDQVPTLTWGSLLARLRAGRIKYLKIDTEGCDCDIIAQVLAHAEKRPDLLPGRIRFETNENTPPATIARTILALERRGYTVTERTACDTEVVLKPEAVAAPSLLPKAVIFTEDSWALGRISEQVARGVTSADVRYLGWGSSWNWARDLKSLAAENPLCALQALSINVLETVRAIVGGVTAICHGVCELSDPRWAPNSEKTLQIVLQRRQVVGAVSRELVDVLAARGVRARLTPCGVDTATFTRPASRDTAGPLKVFIPHKVGSGSHAALKRGDLAARLMAHYVAPGSKVSVYDLPRDMELDGMPEYYREADVVLILSRSEGNPLSVLEGGACGTTVVATPVGVIPEFVTDGVEGFILSDGSGNDDDLFAEVVGVLDRLGNDRALVRRAQDALHAKVVAERAWPVLMKHWDDFFTAAIEAASATVGAAATAGDAAATAGDAAATAGDAAATAGDAVAAAGDAAATAGDAAATAGDAAATAGDAVATVVDAVD
jgi:glycosyltransferase involved in cell wall biosynthesis